MNISTAQRRFDRLTLSGSKALVAELNQQVVKRFTVGFAQHAKGCIMRLGSSIEELFNVPSEPIHALLDRTALPDNVLRDSVVLLTGGASGIGAATVRGLVHLGAKVAFLDKRDQGHQVADGLADAAGEVMFIHLDIAYEENLVCAHELVVERWGAVDILINNAVHFPVQRLVDVMLDGWDYTLATNVRAPVVLAQLVLPTMMERHRGIIMNLMAPEGMAFAAAAAFPMLSL